jgi:RES domain-containing protein
MASRVNGNAIRRRSAQLVCAQCLSNRYLAAVIDTSLPPRVCGFCERSKAVAELTTVVAAVDRRLAEVARRSNSFQDPVDLKAGVRYEDGVHTLEDLVARNLSGSADGVASAIAKGLLVLGKERRAAKTGDEPVWSGRYRYSAVSIPYSPFQLEERWQEYLGFVNNGARFFNNSALQFLDDLFKVIDRLSMNAFFGPTKPVQEQNLGTVWRARVAKTPEVLDKILAKPAAELHAPPPTVAKPGRMNAERVPVFYAARDEKTAVAELRPGIGEQIVVGKFKVTRPVRLLDMLILDRAHGATLSIWDPQFKKREVMRALLKRLHERVRRPIASGAEHEYLATQMLAEYLSVHMHVEGIVFGSAQHEGGRNVVLFPKVLGPFYARLGFRDSPIEYVEGSVRTVKVTGVEYKLQWAQNVPAPSASRTGP